MARSKQGETKAAWQSEAGAEVAARLAADQGAFRPAPVHLWNPVVCGRIDIRIDRDGLWHHEGRPIERASLARLFATVLRREADGSYVLVTPAEKLTIAVDDVPFVAVAIEADEGEAPTLVFITTFGERVPLDPDHPLRIAVGPGDGFIPYLTVRPGLEARLTRGVAADLASRAEIRGEAIGVVSAGHFFVIGGADAVEAA